MDDLHTRLTDQGLTITAFVALNESLALIFLHGPAGDHLHGHALEIVRRTPGVLSAEEAEGVPTIIHARLAEAPPDT